jgi:glycine betaine/proline transport system substrate-binding protein
MVRSSRGLKLLAPLAAVLLFSAACGGAKVGDDSTASAGSSTKCGTVNLAVNPWVGYEANAAIYSYVAEKDLGCKVVKKNITEQVSWEGFSTGAVDAILENWGHEDLAKKYITDQKVAEDLGTAGYKGEIGWYVPPWLAKAHPDILQWQNLNKYATQFKTSESGGKGQLLDGDPSYVTNDAALVQNLKLNFKVVYSGSETALITAMKQAEAKKQWLIMYFYSPQWFLNDVPAVQVQLPKYTTGCDADAKKVACGYPEYDLNKVASTKFAKSGSPAYTFLKNFKLTEKDQNQVAGWIANDKLSDDAAGKKWVDANQATVKAWLSGT